jgi:5'-nucleotidase
MPFDFRQYLVIGISSRALFDLEEENCIFEEQGLEAYSKYQLEHEDDVLEPGVAYPLVQAILKLNGLIADKRKAEIVIMSRNNADTSLRIFKSIDIHKLDITRGAFTSGVSLAPYLHAFDVDLFLSANEADVQDAVNAGVAAARVYDLPKEKVEAPTHQIRIAFDGDAVIFSDEAEEIYQSEGLEAFLQHEQANARKPLSEGPFAKLLKTLAVLQSGFQPADVPIRTALITARNSPAHERVIRTLRTWNVRVDEAFFLGGASKEEVLKVFRPHIYFDDQDVHLKSASRHVPVALVPYRFPAVSQFALEGITPPAAQEPKRRSRGG